jgi:alkanesulfonate monooxygenase SsuD/methylene tetrahydromethanopterin reductase-like flavin-dependent oxidoreductase (luciferase family)
LRRCAKWGDGWMPLAYPPGEEARTAFATLHRYAEEAGRDPATIGIDTRISAGAEAEWREEVRFWKSIGVTHLTLANYYESGHLHPIAGRSLRRPHRRYETVLKRDRRPALALVRNSEKRSR